MKRSLGVAGASLLIGSLIIPVVVLAAQLRVGQAPTLSSSETVKSNAYLAGGNVTSSGSVVGDLVIGGGNIIVNGPVTQDLLAGGGSITVASDVGGDVRIAGGNVLVIGKVGNDVVIGAGQTNISGAGVGGDVLWAGGSLQVNAPVSGNLQLRGGEATINARVHGNVTFKGNKLTLGKDAVIDGNLNYSAQTEATMETGATVKGLTNYTQQKTAELNTKKVAAIFSLFLLGKFLALLFFALVLGLVFRRFARTLVRNALAQPLLETGRGLIVLIVLPIASVMLLVTLIGIMLGILGLISFVALMLVASAFAAIVMGSLAHKWMFKPAEYQVAWQTILLGVVIYTLLGFVPFLGWIVKFLFILAALGSMVKIKWDTAKEWR